MNLAGKSLEGWAKAALATIITVIVGLTLVTRFMPTLANKMYAGKFPWEA